MTERRKLAHMIAASELAAEVARLRSEVEEHKRHVSTVMKREAALTHENEALRKDAKRMDWMESVGCDVEQYVDINGKPHNLIIKQIPGGDCVFYDDLTLRDAIDAAMAQEER